MGSLFHASSERHTTPTHLVILSPARKKKEEGGIVFIMEVELYQSYFTLQCDLETEGRAWAYLNEFMCIGKNRNGYFVCLTSSIPIELAVEEGGAQLVIAREDELFGGPSARRPAAQSMLQFTLKHWKSQAAIDVPRRTTGCLLLPNLWRRELAEDGAILRDLVKRALPEVRAQWHITPLEQHLRSVPAESKREIARKEAFPQAWLLLFGATLSLSSASLATHVYTRETFDFDLELHPLALDRDTFQEEARVQRLPLTSSGFSEDYLRALGLAVELELRMREATLIFRVSYHGPAGQRASKEMTLRMDSDQLHAHSPPRPLSLMEADRLVLTPLSPEESEGGGTPINILLAGDDLSDHLATIFDREAGISVRLDRFLSRR